MAIDLEQLEADRQKAEIDKADLFDFYHANYSLMVYELRRLQIAQGEQTP